MNKFGVGERAPWGDFPPVIVNSLWMTFRNEPEYQAAKSGNEKAALELIDRLLTDSTMQRVTKQIGDSKPLILPVLAVEKAGNNKIPLTMARVLAKRLTLDVEENVLQRERVGRTGTGADHRLAFNPSFEGEIKTGQTYGNSPGSQGRYRVTFPACRRVSNQEDAGRESRTGCGLGCDARGGPASPGNGQEAGARTQAKPGAQQGENLRSIPAAPIRWSIGPSRQQTPSCRRRSYSSSPHASLPG